MCFICHAYAHDKIDEDGNDDDQNDNEDDEGDRGERERPTAAAVHEDGGVAEEEARPKIE